MSEVKFEPFQRVLVRDHDDQYWKASFFSHAFECDVPRTYHTVCGIYRQCIPYNEETAHLLGTGKSPTPPEPEFKFGDKVEVSNNNTDWHKAIYYAACKNKVSNLIALKENLGLIGWKYCRHADW